VLLAQASGAIIVGFHVRPDTKARELAAEERVEIRLYDIIYKAVEDVKAGARRAAEARDPRGGAGKRRGAPGLQALQGRHDRRLHGGLRQYPAHWQGAAVARRDHRLAGRIGSLRASKDDVKEVANGFECGIALDGITT